MDEPPVLQQVHSHEGLLHNGAEFFLRFHQHLLGPPPFGNVAPDDDHLIGIPLRVTHHVSLGLDEADPFVGHGEPVHDALSNARPDGFVKNLSDPLFIVGMDLSERVGAAKARPRTEDRLVGWTVVKAFTVEIDDCDEVVDVGKNEVEKPFRL